MILNTDVVYVPCYQDPVVICVTIKTQWSFALPSRPSSVCPELQSLRHFFSSPASNVGVLPLRPSIILHHHEEQVVCVNPHHQDQVVWVPRHQDPVVIRVTIKTK